MKVLHLYSDRRKTGPIEPVLRMCRGMMDRGHEVLLAYRGGGTGDLPRSVERAGVAATTRFALNRYHNPLDTARDLIRLPAFLRQERFDILHTHLSHDRMLGLTCNRLAGPHRPRVVSCLHRRDPLPSRWGYRRLLPMHDGLLAFTPGFRQTYLDRFPLDPRRVGVLPMTIDLNRFDPDRSYRDMRQAFGIPPDAVVIGIVGRFQRYRKMEVFLAAAKRLVAHEPNVRFLIMGRSRSRPATVDEPVKRLGLGEHAIIAGYRRDDYADCLACMDLFTLLMPGSDGTARAVREAMAMAKPCVVSDYGMLPEIVPDGRAGRVVSMDAEALADGWLELVRDATRRREMGREARRIAERRFDPTGSAEALEQFYEQVLALPKV